MNSRSTRNKTNARLVHITDSEGSDQFFKSIHRSSFLSYSQDKGLQFKDNRPTDYFIFGGDATDRGRHDLEILEALLDFKERFPEQVFLIVGNREITKNRLRVELSEKTIRQRL